MARRIDLIVIHCSATHPDWNIGVNEIKLLHTAPPDERVFWDGDYVFGNGWKDIGYHYVVRRNGVIEEGRPESKIGAHVKGHNRSSLGICLVGGISGPHGTPEANFTRMQYGALEELLQDLTWRHSGARIRGHRDLTDQKACPSFDVVRWWYGKEPSD